MGKGSRPSLPAGALLRPQAFSLFLHVLPPSLTGMSGRETIPKEGKLRCRELLSRSHKDAKRLILCWGWAGRRHKSEASSL